MTSVILKQIHTLYLFSLGFQPKNCRFKYFNLLFLSKLTIRFYKRKTYNIKGLAKLEHCIKAKSSIYFYPSSIKSKNGFTLVELIVTIAVLAIIATIATPSILTQLAHMEAKRIRSQLTTTLATAKAESYIRRQNLLVCLSNTGGRCHRDSEKKLLLFIDSNDNQHFDSNTDQLLSEQSLNPKYSTLSLRAGNRHYTKFWGDSGKPRGHFGHIKYCPTSTYNHNMYQISFNQGGIVKYKPNSAHDTGC